MKPFGAVQTFNCASKKQRYYCKYLASLYGMSVRDLILSSVTNTLPHLSEYDEDTQKKIEETRKGILEEEDRDQVLKDFLNAPGVNE